MMTFNSLVVELQSYLDRLDADTLSNIPNFIYQAENRLSRECKSIGNEQYITAAFLPGNPIITKPGRWRRTLGIQLGTGPTLSIRNQLYLRSYEYVRSYAPDPTLLGQPLYYADMAYLNWIFAPTPDFAYPFEISYLELPEPLSLAVQTNWLTNFCPDALLYACLLEAIPYLKSDERIPVWQSMYDRSLASLNGQDFDRYLARSSSRESD